MVSEHPGKRVGNFRLRANLFQHVMMRRKCSALRSFDLDSFWFPKIRSVLDGGTYILTIWIFSS